MLFRGDFPDSILGSDCLEQDYTKECFEEFVSGLRSARGDKFLGRMAMLTQLSNFLNLPIAVTDL